jgi:toxin ParE1/3/4
MKLVWSKRASADLEQIGDFIAQDQPARARNHVQLLIDRAKEAIKFPQSGRIVPEVRDLNLREFIEGNYRIVYEIFETSKTVVVVTVFEAHKLVDKKLKKK